MYLALVDKYGQIVGSDSESKVTVIVDTAYSDDDPEANVYKPIIEGTSQFFAEAGVYNISDIIFSATPGSSYRVLFQTDGID